jgi:hypothetical protein
MYANRLSVKVSKAELQARFTAIDTFVNTTKLKTNTVEACAIEYRHLKQAPKYALMCDKDPLTVINVSYAGWYATNAVVKHIASSNTEMRVHVQAMVGCTSAQEAAPYHRPTRACIGRSTDGGATWTAIDATIRWLGNGCGDAKPLYRTLKQKHYLTGAANYFPINTPSDHAIQLVATFGGTPAMGSATVNNAYCVMLDSDCASYDAGEGLIYEFYAWAIIELNARENA